MRTTTDLKNIILAQAGELFAQQGYTATSNKQIAQAAGCTPAALYYYFPEGKTQILRAVIHSYTLDLSQLFEQGQQVQTLHDFLLAFGQSVANLMPEVLHRIVWLQLEFAQLAQPEKMVVQNLFLSLHEGIATELTRILKHEETANHLAWLLFCAYFGYEQIFLSMEVNGRTSFPMGTLTQTLAQMLHQGYP